MNFRQTPFEHDLYQNATSSTTTSETKLLGKSFAFAGVGFLLIMLIGIITSAVVRQVTGLGSGVAFDWDGIYGPKAMRLYLQLTIVASLTIIVSSVLSIVWLFRFMKSSKTFIFIMMSTYVIGQGIGFGLLFTIWNASELISIFGVATLLFASMSIFGLTSKKIANMGRFLFVATMAFLAASLFSFIFYWIGLYSNTLIIVMNIVGGLLMMLYTAWDVHRIKKMQEYLDVSGNTDKVMQFRLVAWFGFRLLSDFITMIWYLMRLYSRIKR